MSRLFKSIISKEIFARIVRTLHLSRLMKNLYFLLFGPRDGLKTLKLEGFEAKLFVKNYSELRALDTVFHKDLKAEDEVIKAMFEIAHRGDTVYDVGANMGVHTIFMALKVGEHGKIVAFEPENSMYVSLRKNILVNKLSNVIPLQIALGDKNEIKNMYGKPRIGRGAFSLMRGEESEFSQQVGVFKGDYIVLKNRLPLPEIVKIDVEGYEYFVIDGLRETLSSEICRAVFCEIHPKLLGNIINAKNIMDLIISLGFNNIHSRQRGDEIQAFCYKE